MASHASLEVAATLTTAMLTVLSVTLTVGELCRGLALTAPFFLDIVASGLGRLLLSAFLVESNIRFQITRSCKSLYWGLVRDCRRSEKGQRRILEIPAIFLGIVFRLEHQSPTIRDKGDRTHEYLHPRGDAREQETH